MTLLHVIEAQLHAVVHGERHLTGEAEAEDYSGTDRQAVRWPRGLACEYPCPQRSGGPGGRGNRRSRGRTAPRPDRHVHPWPGKARTPAARQPGPAGHCPRADAAAADQPGTAPAGQAFCAAAILVALDGDPRHENGSNWPATADQRARLSCNCFRLCPNFRLWPAAGPPCHVTCPAPAGFCRG